MNDDLNVSIYGKGFSDVNTCAYGDTISCKVTSATEASDSLCCCDNSSINTYSTRDAVLNTYTGDYVEETKTISNLPQFKINWDTTNHRYEIGWDLCTNPTEKDNITVYKASRKFKRITIK